jgi:hypothetical protein
MARAGRRTSVDSHHGSAHCRDSGYALQSEAAFQKRIIPLSVQIPESATVQHRVRDQDQAHLRQSHVEILGEVGEAPREPIVKVGRVHGKEPAGAQARHGRLTADLRTEAREDGRRGSSFGALLDFTFVASYQDLFFEPICTPPSEPDEISAIFD